MAILGALEELVPSLGSQPLTRLGGCFFKVVEKLCQLLGDPTYGAFKHVKKLVVLIVRSVP